MDEDIIIIDTGSGSRCNLVRYLDIESIYPDLPDPIELTEYRCLEHNPCKADPDFDKREYRTNKRLQNQPFYLRSRNGKMRKY